MARKEIGNPLDRENRNNHNDNYKELFKEIGVVDKRIDGMIDEISDQAFDKVIDNSKLNWKEPVNNFNSLPSSAQNGDTRMDRSTGKVYRYDGSEWKEIQQIDAGPVNELDSRLTSQLNEESNENPIFRSGKDDLPQLGNELINDATVNLGSGWTGNANGGFTHSKGSTDLLELTIPALKANTIYNVEVNITNPAEVDNGQSDYWLTLGESNEFETYKGRTNRVVWGIKTINGNKLIIRPYEEYSGTITLSVKEVLTRIEPYAVYEDSQSGRTSEARYSDADIESIYLGKNSGSYANEFAEQNTVFGNYAGENITSGFWNVLLGYNAGRYGTTATRNVAIGRHALMENITGNRIVAIGSWAVMRNKTGENLIGIGADSLYNNIDGSDNIGIGTVAIGQNPNGKYLIGLGDRVMSGSEGGEHTFAAGRLTLYYNKGSHNAAIGQQAGYQNRGGSHNFLVGFRAGMLNQVGDHIIAVGNETLYNNLESSNIGFGNRSQYHNKTGKYNLSIGHQSSYENQVGNYNISAGFEALYSNKHDENIALGRLSGRDLDGEKNIAVGSLSLRYIKGNNNIGIGASAGKRVDAKGSHNLFIGSNSGANHLDGDRNILIGYDVRKALANTSDELNIGNVVKSKDMTTGIVELQKLQLTNLPTSAPAQSGMVWNDNGTLKISA